MAHGGHPGDPGEAEKARYRRKLAEWRAMGFDVSALEVLLETDFEKFKEKRFELMRSQIHGAGPAPHAPPPERPPGPAPPPQAPAPPAPRSPEPPPAYAFPRRPGLHSHFVQPPRPPETPPPPGDAASRHERLHSEMRYPSARRRRPEKEVRTFSVAVEPERRPRGISVGEGPSQAANAPAPKRRLRAPSGAPPPVPPRNRQKPRDEERPGMAPDETDASGTAERRRPAVEDGGAQEGPGRRAAAEEEHLIVEEEPAGPEPEEAAEGEETEAGEEEPDAEETLPSLGYFTPASRLPMKPRERPPPARVGRTGTGRGPAPPIVKRKLRKVAVRPRPAAGPRRPSRGWVALAVVVALVVAGLAGYMYLAPRTTLAARAAFPATAEAGALVAFDGGNSTTTGKGIDRYAWDFGDGARGSGKRATHFYEAAGAYTVSLTVQDQDGTRSAPYRSRITVSPLTVTVPAKKIDDRADYAVNGTVDVRNQDTYLYKVTLASQEVTVSELQLDFIGNMTQMVRDQLPAQDGFGQNHSALFTTSSEDLSLSGKAFTNIMQLQLSGDLNYDEDSCSDAASGGVFKVQSRAVTKLRFILPTGPASLNSTDTLRAYPGVAGIQAQFQPEDIYRGRAFDQAGGDGNGTYRSGNVTYHWSRMGVRNIGGYPSLGLNITAERAYLDKNGFSEFFINVWISSFASMPTSTLVHIFGRSGDTTVSTDHLTTMTGFKAGPGTIDYSPQAFDPSPLPPGLFYSPFSDVIATGTGNASLRFSPEQALQEASAKDGSLRDFLAQNPQSYACSAKYYEGQFGPGSATWNLTFSWPNATSSYWANVTRDILQQYTVHGGYGGGLSQVGTSEGAFARMLTLSSAEGRMRNDSETAGVFFRDGAVNWAGGTSLGLEADAMYPSINLASLYASPERAGYATLLRKGADTSAFSADTGQMMYFYTHSGS